MFFVYYFFVESDYYCLRYIMIDLFLIFIFRVVNDCIFFDGIYLVKLVVFCYYL